MSLQPGLSPYHPTYYPFSQMYPRPQSPGNTPEGLGLVFYVISKGSHPSPSHSPSKPSFLHSLSLSTFLSHSQCGSVSTGRLFLLPCFSFYLPLPLSSFLSLTPSTLWLPSSPSVLFCFIFRNTASLCPSSSHYSLCLSSFPHLYSPFSACLSPFFVRKSPLAGHSSPLLHLTWSTATFTSSLSINGTFRKLSLSSRLNKF